MGDGFPPKLRIPVFLLWTAMWVGLTHVLGGGLGNFLNVWGVLFLGVAVGEGIVEVWGMGANRRSLEVADAGLKLLPLAFLGVSFAVLDAGRLHLTPVAPWVKVLGVVLGYGGILGRVWSQRTLGSAFKVHVEASDEVPLVREGPYRYLRHPSYTALVLVLAGSPLIVGSLVGAVIGFLGLLPFILLRVRHEESVLLEAYGETYREYMEEVPGLVPGFRRSG